MSEFATAADAVTTSASEWHGLPARARSLFALSRVAPLAMPAAVGGFFLFHLLDASRLLGAVTGVVLASGLGVWLGFRQFRHVAWRLDGDGLAIRRGKLVRDMSGRISHERDEKGWTHFRVHLPLAREPRGRARKGGAVS